MDGVQDDTEEQADSNGPEHEPRPIGWSPPRPPGHPGSADLADSDADEPPPPDSEVEVLLLGGASFPEAGRGSFDEPSFDEPSFDGVFEGALRKEESELVELRESVL